MLGPGGGGRIQRAAPPIEQRHTFEGWKECGGEIEKAVVKTEQRRGAVPLQERLDHAKQIAFNRASRSKLLLEEPPKKPERFVDLRPFLSPIENQESIGSCTAHSVMGLIEYLQIATRGDYVDGSRLFLYKATRNLLQWLGDSGAYIRETIKAVRLFGICPEQYWDYKIGAFDEEPPSFCYSFAANYKSLRYYRLKDLNEVLLTLSQGYPVAFGFTCFESLLTDQVQHTGIIPYPTLKEKTAGGHAVLAVGFNEGEKSVNGCPPNHVIIRNSWGTGWGDSQNFGGGYGYLPYEYFREQEHFIGDGVKETKKVLPLADDFWTITAMQLPDLEFASAAPFIQGSGNPVQRIAAPFKRMDRGNSPLARGNPVQY